MFCESKKVIENIYKYMSKEKKEENVYTMKIKILPEKTEK